ncbi:MAG: CIA30 family protein [Bacteroidota bacterium]
MNTDKTLTTIVDFYCFGSMKNLILFTIVLCTFEFNTMVLFDFTPESDLSRWYVVDDGVMGGLSQGNFGLDDEGHAIFRGTVSLENNGGFSSIRYRSGTVDVSAYEKVVLRLKGDGKKYQFRMKSSRYDRHSYIQYFETNGEWQTIEIPLSDLYPTFRGRTLRMSNYPGEIVEEIAFLIGNKKAENFNLVIDKIELE